jgi:glycine dehydrogenase subunit 1
MDVSNAGHYDGATALAESVLVALRAGEGAKRNRVLVPESLHPEYRQVLETYLAPRAPVIETYDSSKPGFEASGDGLACVVAAYPDFFGSIPAALLDGQDAGSFADAVHAQGGLLIVHTDPIMLGLFKNPASFGADMVTAEGQCLGNDMNFGGPGLGIMAVKESLMRRIPGRIVGEAFDAQNRRGFVLTLAAREQHIRREKAASNICSNEGLAMLRAAIYLALMGKTGLKQTAELCWHKSHYAAKTLAALPGCAVPQLKSDVSFFKEFVLSLPVNAEAASEKMFERGIVMGLPLSRYYPERTHEVLVCVTEENTREDIDAYAAALKEVLEELQ